VSADGKLITNFHVVDHAPTLRVRLEDKGGITFPLVLTADKAADLALLKMSANQHPFLRLACASQPEIGSTVFSIGNPLGVLENTFSQGIISGVRQVNGHTLLQTSAPISHGNSGGPLLNAAGEVVGITTATVEAGQNLNFAVPADQEVVPQVFSVRVTKPRPLLLRFEYPERVGSETFINTVQGQASVGMEPPKGLYKRIFDIPSKSIKKATLRPGDFVDGDVYFEGSDRKPRDFVLNLFLGHDAYQIPFSAPK
jgi:hypothetical protein